MNSWLGTPRSPEVRTMAGPWILARGSSSPMGMGGFQSSTGSPASGFAGTGLDLRGRPRLGALGSGMEPPGASVFVHAGSGWAGRPGPVSSAGSSTAERWPFAGSASPGVGAGMERSSPQEAIGSISIRMRSAPPSLNLITVVAVRHFFGFLNFFISFSCLC